MPIDVESGQQGGRAKLIYNQYNFCWNGRVWCVRDYPGAACVFFGYVLVGYAIFVIVYIVIIPSSCWIFKISNSIALFLIVIMAISSHIRSMLTDPGAVPILENPIVDNDTKICAKCGCVKPPKAHHCSVCRRCIRKMDHHCPWMNNCVGEDNLKFFILYNFYIACFCCYTFVLLVIVLIDIVKGRRQKKNESFEVIAVSMGILEAVAFAVFSIGIGMAQVINLLNDITYIEKLQNADVHGTGSKCEYYQAVFGEKFWEWFSPFTKKNTES